MDIIILFRCINILKIWWITSYNIMPKRVRFIYPKENTESNLFMLEAVKNGKYGLKLESPLYVHNNDGSYKEEILKMFNEG